MQVEPTQEQHNMSEIKQDQQIETEETRNNQLQYDQILDQNIQAEHGYLQAYSILKKLDLIDKDKEQTDIKLVQISFDSDSDSVFTDEAGSYENNAIELI